jgi:hypothetical protein
MDLLLEGGQPKNLRNPFCLRTSRRGVRIANLVMISFSRAPGYEESSGKLEIVVAY